MPLVPQGVVALNGCLLQSALRAGLLQSVLPVFACSEHMLCSGPPITSGNGHGSQKGKKSMFSGVF